MNAQEAARILALRRFSIFTINLSEKKGDTNVINNRKQV